MELKIENFIFEFGTQWQTNGGPKYICDNATQIKYVEGKCYVLPDNIFNNWVVCNNYKIKDIFFPF